MEIFIGIIALLCGGALLRWASKNSWRLLLIFVIWVALVRLALRSHGDKSAIVVMALTALVIFVAYILPWLGRLKIIMIIKGALIILWRRINGLAKVAEDVAKSEIKEK